MSRQPAQRERTKRAFRAYLELLDAGEELRVPLRSALELVDLTLEGFRLLELLDREGALPITWITKEARGNTGRLRAR